MGLPTQQVLTVGGYTFLGSELSTLIILYGTVSTSGRVTTVRKANTTSGYQVTAGKTLTVKAVVLSGNSTQAVCTLLYGDTDVSANSVSDPTNAVYMCGGTSTNRVHLAPGGTSATAVNPMVVDFTVPATKYPAVLCEGSSANTVILYCLEA